MAEFSRGTNEHYPTLLVDNVVGSTTWLSGFHSTAYTICVHCGRKTRQKQVSGACSGGAPLGCLAKIESGYLAYNLPTAE